MGEGKGRTHHHRRNIQERKKLKKPLDLFKKLHYLIFMMNDLMPTIEEAATPDILAQIEHEEWERGNEQRERWEAIEAEHGQLLTITEWFAQGTLK